MSVVRGTDAVSAFSYFVMIRAKLKAASSLYTRVPQIKFSGSVSDFRDTEFQGNRGRNQGLALSEPLLEGIFNEVLFRMDIELHHYFEAVVPDSVDAQLKTGGTLCIAFTGGYGPEQV